jgi:hypothetical protein
LSAKIEDHASRRKLLVQQGVLLPTAAPARVMVVAVEVVAALLIAKRNALLIVEGRKPPHIVCLSLTHDQLQYSLLDK